MYVVCVNDGAVMAAWKKDQGLAGSDLIEFAADTNATLTDALGARCGVDAWWPRQTLQPSRRLSEACGRSLWGPGQRSYSLS